MHMGDSYVRLGVNIDHVATVRNARGGVEPEPLTAAAMCELGGADGITVHLREDRRHIRDRDVYLLRETVQVPLNLEMAVDDDIVAVALDVKPDTACLVPEKRQELTTEGGLDVLGNFERIKAVTDTLQSAGIRVSLFIDPDIRQMEAAGKAGATFVEIHTGAYADTKAGKQRHELQNIMNAAKFAHEAGLIVNMGHGLDYRNIRDILAFSHLYEVNIGHSIISRAVFVGLTEAVREMRTLLDSFTEGRR